MTAVVMKVVEAKEHPNADALRVYTMRANGSDVQIVANLENVYEEGDHAVVVFANSTLLDGTKIRDARIRGVSSYGMALGKSDLWVGTDVSDIYCKPEGVDGLVMQKWPSIESLYNIRRSMARAGTEREVAYVGKVKLDGTNAGVQVSKDGKIAAQSRTKIITPDDDNMGFAKWVEEHRGYFSGLAGNKHMTVFGEFCGKGIQKGTAISQLDHKVFVVFAIQYGGVDGEPSVIDINPVSIYDRLGDKPNDVHVLHFKPPIIRRFNFTNKEALTEQVEELNQVIAEIEQCDPWVKEEFGIEGVGEGLVMYPLPAGTDYYEADKPMLIDAFEYSELVFKAKGEKHKVTKTKKPAQIDPEVAKNIDDFVNMFATDARLQQALGEIELDPKNTGSFIKAFSKDVQKESEAELEASGLTWKQVAKNVATTARKWFLDKCNKA